MKRTFFDVGLIVLPFLGYGMDLWKDQLRTQISQTFNPFPPILLMILSDIVFAAVAFWLTQQTQVTHIPAGVAAILLIAGLAVVCIPLLSRMSCSGSAQFFVSWMPVHHSIAGVFLFIMGLVALIWKSKPATG
jgi:NAD/NADP transhydrogenase beta subunit